VLGPSEGGLGGEDAPDGFPASGRDAYPSGANAFFADGSCTERHGVVISMTGDVEGARCEKGNKEFFSFFFLFLFFFFFFISCMRC